MANNHSKPNSYLNGLWASHAKKYEKRQTSKTRRRDGRGQIRAQYENIRWRPKGR